MRFDLFIHIDAIENEMFYESSFKTSQGRMGLVTTFLDTYDVRASDSYTFLRKL